MISGVLANNEVLVSIVVPDSIDVMNHTPFGERFPEGSLNNENVLHHIIPIGSGVPWAVEIPIPIGPDSPPPTPPGIKIPSRAMAHDEPNRIPLNVAILWIVVLGNRRKRPAPAMAIPIGDFSGVLR
jgi:hypothetical protein